MLKEITEARDLKVKQNFKIVSDTEALVVKTIQEARFKMTGKKLWKEKVFKFKDSAHCDDSKIQVPDFQYPPNPSFDNPIVGFIHNPTGYVNGLNVIMSNGDKSNLA